MKSSGSKVPAKKGPVFNGSSMLRDRILREARVLPNSIIDVSNFMESYVDMVSSDCVSSWLSVPVSMSGCDWNGSST